MRLFQLSTLLLLIVGCQDPAENPPEAESTAAPANAAEALEVPQVDESTATEAVHETDAEDLAGKWQIVHGKDGEHKHQVTLATVSENRYRLEPENLSFNGVYELDGDRLKMVDENPGYPDLVWERRSADAWVMVEGGYLGAVLWRGDEFDPSILAAKDDSETQPEPKVVGELEGAWEIVSGKNGKNRHQVTLDTVSENRYRLAPESLIFSGVYELDGERLKMVDENLGYPDLVWERQSPDSFLMVEGDALGATMVRQKTE